MTEQMRYTKQEMLALSHDKGFRASEELLDDWIKYGLMGKADQHVWCGRGKGSVVWWSDKQCELFLTLLHHRQDLKIPRGQLANIPVWLWLYWGDQGGVLLPQVRRALDTWVVYRKYLPQKKVQKDARELVNLYQGPNPQHKRKLIQLLKKIGTLQEEVDQEVLYHYSSLVTDPQSKKSKVQSGPVQAFFATPEYISTMIPLRLKALRAYPTIQQLPDCLWLWARTLLLVTVLQSQAAQPHLATDPKWGSRFPPLHVNYLCESACYYLLTILGIAQQKQFAEGNEPYHEYFHPDAWKPRGCYLHH